MIYAGDGKYYFFTLNPMQELLAYKTKKNGERFYFILRKDAPSLSCKRPYWKMTHTVTFLGSTAVEMRQTITRSK